VSLWLIVSVEITNYRMGDVVMISQGVIFKQCGCQDPASGRQLRRTCPQLAEGKHGRWYFHVSVTNLMGRRERVRRGGYPTRAAALWVPRTSSVGCDLHLLDPPRTAGQGTRGSSAVLL
jgi:hypothetical protein